MCAKDVDAAGGCSGRDEIFCQGLFRRGVGRAGEDLLYGIGGKSLVLAESLHLESGAHRSAERENAEDIAGAGELLAAFEDHDGMHVLDGGSQVRGQSSSDSGF